MIDKNEVLRDYVSDMLAVENHTLSSIERQTRDNAVRVHREAYQVLMKIETVLSSHKLALENYLSTMDGEGTEPFWKKAASTAIGAMAGMYGRLRPGDPVSRDLRDDYTALSLAVISYSMLHTTAMALHDEIVSEMALRHLNELTPLVMELSNIIPPVVAQELAKEGKVFDPTVAHQAVKNIQQAWNGKNLS